MKRPPVLVTPGDVTVRVGLGLFEPFGASVKELGSSIDARNAEGAMDRGWAELGGEGAELGGGGGGGAEGEAWPVARIAACIAKLELAPLIDGCGGGGGGRGG